MGAIFLYTQIFVLPLSLSLSLSLNLKKDKSQEKDIYIRGTVQLLYVFDTLKSVYNCSKGIHVFLCHHVVYVVISCFFSASIRLMLSCIELSLLILLKYHTGNRSCRLLQFNIITTKTYRSVFFCYLRERSLAAWWVCDSGKFWKPLCQRRSVWL